MKTPPPPAPLIWLHIWKIYQENKINEDNKFTQKNFSLFAIIA